MVLSRPYFSINVYETIRTQIYLNRFYLVFLPFVLPNRNEIYFGKTFAILTKTYSFNEQIFLDFFLNTFY